MLIAVAVGGALGALARHALTLAFPTASTGFPWTVLAINVIGSGLLALLPSLVRRRHELLAPLLGPGVLGGFTTLSAYGEQARSLAASGRTGLAASYVVGTLVAALAAVALVDLLTRRGAR